MNSKNQDQAFVSVNDLQDAAAASVAKACQDTADLEPYNHNLNEKTESLSKSD